MKYLLLTGMLACAASAVAQPTCTAERPCLVMPNVEAGTEYVVQASAPGTAVPQQPVGADTQNADRGNAFIRSVPGRDALSLEEMAVDYFRQIAEQDAKFPGGNKPFDPDNVMWDRNGLTDQQAAEVLKVARRVTPTKARRNDADKAEFRDACEKLGKAKGADAQLAVIEDSHRRTQTRNKGTGKSALQGLTPSTRARVLEILAKEREGVTVEQRDWAAVRATQPEELEMFRARACSGVY